MSAVYAEKDAWYALTISILKGVPPENAYRLYEKGPNGFNYRHSTLTDKDTEDMIAMREEGMYYKKIGEIYDMKPSAVYNRINRYKQKNSIV